MYRLLKTLLLLPWLSACAPAWPDSGLAPDGNGALRPGANPDFNWRLSGDRQVAPLQVFDDGRQTWLHFAAGQAVPAIFAEQNGVQHPLPYVRREPYIIVRGKWPALVMRGGALQARADYLGGMALPHAMAPNPSPAAIVPSPAPADPVPAGAHAEAVAATPSKLSGPSTPAVLGAAPGQTAPRTSPIANAITSGASSAQPAKAYRVDPADENMRRALARWAGIAGWTFQPEHWAVDVDIPLSGSADFSDDFKQSVRDLLGATELGERPLQPCFYANRVVRVVPLSQACDRTARAGAGA